MAQKSTKSQGSSSRSSRNTSSRNSSSRNGADPSKRLDGERRAQQAHLQDDPADSEYRRYWHREEEDRVGPPDVFLDVPELHVDFIHLELDDLDAHVALKANVLNLVKLNVGIDAHLSRVRLDIKGVEAEVLLKARLDHVAAIVDRLMTTLDRNPQLIEGLSKAVSEVGQGAGEAVGRTGDAVKDIGHGAQSTVKDVGKGAGDAVGKVGQGAGDAVGNIGQGAGQAVGDVGQGAGQAVGNLDQLVGGVGQAGQGGVGGLSGQGGPGGGPGQPGAQQNGGAPVPAAGSLAKEFAKLVAREVGHAASDEARDLSLAAARKVRELGERRQHRRAEKHRATAAAVRMAQELGIDLDEIEGTGADGQTTVKDVRKAQSA